MPEWVLIILAILGIIVLGFFFAALDFFRGLTRFLIFGLLVFLLFLLANRLLPPATSNQPEIATNDIVLILLSIVGLVIVFSVFSYVSRLIDSKGRELLNSAVKALKQAPIGNKRITVVGNYGRRSRETIVSLKLLNKEVKVASLTTFVSTAAAIFYTSVGTSSFFKPPISLYVLWTTVATVVILVWLRLALLSYRIRKGYYGNNQYEAKELISFIIKEINHLPPPGGGGQMRAFPDTENDEDAIWGEGLAGEGNQ